MKKDFEILKNITYLDSAATSQKPKQVINKLNEFYEKYNANAHRGFYDLSLKASDILDSSRENISDFINAKSVIFTKNATEASNLIAYSYGLNNLNKDDEIVLSIMEHHANIVPWQYVSKKTGAKLKYLYLKNYEISKKEIIKKITPKTKIVCITHVSNVLGTVNDIKYIIDYAHKMGAIVIVDAAQSITHYQIDVKKLDVDFLYFSAHKMLAPLGVGVLYAKEELLSKMPPFLMGGDMIEYVYEQETTFANLPNKFEAGTQDIAAIYALSEAINYIKNIGYEKIQKHSNELMNYALEKLNALDYIQTYISKNNHSFIIAFNVKNVHAHDVSSFLSNDNICIRVGDHCAQPLHRYLNINSTCRISFQIYNTKEDIDKLIESLTTVEKMFHKIIVGDIYE